MIAIAGEMSRAYPHEPLMGESDPREGALQTPLF